MVKKEQKNKNEVSNRDAGKYTHLFVTREKQQKPKENNNKKKKKLLK